MFDKNATLDKEAALARDTAPDENVALGEELSERLERHSPEIATRVVEKLAAELPLYGRLPADELSKDIRRVVEQNLEFFVTTFREHRAPGERELAEVRTWATARAGEGVPLEAVIAAYHLGARVAWDTIVADLGPAELAWVTSAHDHVISYLQAVVPAITAGYDIHRADFHRETERDL